MLLLSLGILFLLSLLTLTSPPKTSIANAVPTLPSPGQITGTVYDDRNGNGTKDAGEPGINNVTITLVNGPAVITDNDGTYGFSNVAPGDHTVNLTVPNGYVAAGPTSRTVNVVSGGTAVADFTLLGQGVIQGVVFEDINGNGRKDVAEPGLAGVTINRSTGPAGTTDANGVYRFTNVNPGSYDITVNVPNGYAAGGLTTQTVNLTSSGAAYANFPLLARGVVQGVVYEDRNGNGSQGSSEPGIAGVIVQLGNGPTTTTSATGAYSFANVNPGTYDVRLTLPTGYVGNVTVKTVNLAGGGAAQANFALLAQGVIQGSVFDDLNGNGVQDEGEPGIPGVTIARGTAAPITTNTEGRYRFNNVNPGTHTVKMTVPNGYAAGGVTEVQLNIGSGGSAQVNFTLLAQGVIQGVVYEDRNGNGSQDSSEPGVGGVVITRGDGATTTTSANGSFKYSNVTPGNYTVRMTVPAGYFAAGDTEHQANVINGGAAQANFRLLAKGSIQGVVYQDLNLNGVQDNDEPGVAGVTVTRGTGGPSTTTDANGSYLFGDVPPGSYPISIVLPNGYFSQGSTTHTVSVSSGGASYRNFPLFVQGIIQGVVYEDRNGNGLQDYNEPGLGGVSVRRNDGQTQVTSGSGFYRFANVTPDTYTLEMTVPGGFVAAGQTTRQVNVGQGGSAQANFRLLAKGIIRGVVYEDRNGNGRQDIGEAGVGGVTVTRGTGPAVTTDAGGGYSYSGVTPGSYSLQLSVPTGYVAGGATERLVNITSGGSAQANFAILAQGVIQGVVFDDLNGNGVQDTGEAGVSGVTLLRSDNRAVTTDAGGGYRYNNVTPDDYGVAMTLPGGYIAGGPTSRTVTVSSGGSAQANFAILAQGVIQGVVYEDRNGNGYQDGEEPGVGGIAIGRNDGQENLTDGSGGYRYENVTPGGYTLALLALPDGYVPTGLTSTSVNVGSGGSAQANFAVFAQGVIQGVVYEDRNGNDTQDNNEPGVGGVEVNLGDDASQVTDLNGAYRFDDIAPGDYALSVGTANVQVAGGLRIQTLPDGYVPSGPTVRTITLASGSSTQANFTLLAKGVIQGVVFDDLNSNGSQDAGEPGVPGATITRDDGATVASDSHGAYQFVDVEPDSYSLAITLPSGYVAGGATTRSVNVSSGSSATANFVVYAKGVIQGTVFEDTNANLTHDANEPGVGGVTIKRNDGATAVTDSSGGFRFRDVDPGGYSLVITVPDAYVVGDVDSLDVNVGSGGAAGASFPLNAKGVIQGIVFDDLNNNGVRDGGELGIGGVIITRSDGPSTKTSSNGSYRFDNVPPAAFTLEMTVPTGYIAAQTPIKSVSVNVGASALVNFVVQAEGVIQGVVFDDLNRNGTQDVGEPGIGGVVVTRDENAATTTNSNGSYQFIQSPPGAYDITLTVPNGYTVDGVSVQSIDLASGGAQQINFGLQATNVIQGVVFEDRNGNTYQDVGEPGIGGVTIQIYYGGSATTVTDSSGGYRFTDQAAGYYGLRMINPPGYSAIRSNYKGVTVGDSSIAQANFMLQSNGVVQGVVFYDRNYNGRQDYGEPGIGGIQVSGPQIVRTSSNGTYRMTNVPARSYYVTVRPPDYFAPGSLNPLLVNIPSNGTAQANFALDYLSRGVVEGVAFEDLNFNSFPDQGERGIGGLSLRLYRYDYTTYSLNPLLSTTASAYNGTFRLTQAQSRQAHAVTIPQLSGYSGYTRYHFSTNYYGNSLTTLRFPFRRLNTIAGYVFVDGNANYYPEGGEPGLGGIVVQLFDRTGTRLASTRTTADGRYQFTNVNRTSSYQYYRVVVVGSIGSDYEFAAGNSYFVGLYPHWATYRNFAVRERNTVVGTAVPGTELTFTSTSVQAAGEAVPQATFKVNVPASGEYSLRDLPPGDYTVTQKPPEGFYAPADPVNFNLDDGDSAAANFKAQAANSIAGAVYADSNGNGQRDDGETGLGRVVIDLRQGNTTVQTTTTTLQGTYQFGELELGSYTVVENVPDGYTSITPGSVTVALSADSTVGRASFGNRSVRTITGVVFRDDNFNGVQDAGEDAIDAVVVELLPETGSKPIASATTAAVTGEYRFDGIQNGSYRVRVETIPDHNITTTRVAGVTISADSNSATVNFGQTLNTAMFYLPFMSK